MDKTQKEKFEEWCYKNVPGKGFPDDIKVGWQACLEANGIGEEPRIPEGYYKPGEKVQAKGDMGIWEDDFEIMAVGNSGLGPVTRVTSIAKNIRRIPAWKPKDGEAVLFEDDGHACAGVYDNGQIHFSHDGCNSRFYNMKPFEASKIGKPWSEIV